MNEFITEGYSPEDLEKQLQGIMVETLYKQGLLTGEQQYIILQILRCGGQHQR